jgi:hypothetical protein
LLPSLEGTALRLIRPAPSQRGDGGNPLGEEGPGVVYLLLPSLEGPGVGYLLLPSLEGPGVGYLLLPSLEGPGVGYLLLPSLAGPGVGSLPFPVPVPSTPNQSN